MSESFRGFCLHGKERIYPNDHGSVTRNTSVVDLSLPELQEGEILARPIYTGICGSDNSACLGKPNFEWVERPRIIGHECSAEVLALGPGDHGGLKVGDRFSPVAQLGCQKDDCPACMVGKWNLCPAKTILGFHRDGGFGQRMVLESDRAVPFIEGLTPQQGALVEPLSVACNAIYNKCNIRPGMDVVVTGCGIIGLMSAELARAAGARVLVTGIEHDRHKRLKLAAERGFITAVVSPEKPIEVQLKAGIRDQNGVAFGQNGKVDAVLECSGVPQVLAAAGEMVRPDGDIIVIATYPAPVEFNATQLTRSSHNMRGVMGSSKDDFVVAQRLLVQGVFPADEYVDLYEFDDIQQAFEDSIRANNVKAVIRMN